MINREHVGVDHLNIGIISIILLLMNYGMLSALKDGHEPVVVIDENVVRRLGLSSLRSNVLSNETSKPVVIIDENTVRHFYKPKESVQRKTAVIPHTSNNTGSTHNINQVYGRNITSMKLPCVEKPGDVHGKCFPSGNANNTNSVGIQRTFWIPERALRYLGGKVTALLNMSANYDYLNDNLASRSSSRSSDKIRNYMQLKSRLQQNKIRGDILTTKEKWTKGKIAFKSNLSDHVNGNITKSVNIQRTIPPLQVFNAVKPNKRVAVSLLDLKSEQNNTAPLSNITNFQPTNETDQHYTSSVPIKEALELDQTSSSVNSEDKATFTNITIPRDVVHLEVNETLQPKELLETETRTDLQKSIQPSNGTMEVETISADNETAQSVDSTAQTNKTAIKTVILPPNAMPIQGTALYSSKAILRQDGGNNTVQQTAVFSPTNITDLPTPPSTPFKEEEIDSFSDRTVQENVASSTFNESSLGLPTITDSIRTPLTTNNIGEVSQEGNPTALNDSKSILPLLNSTVHKDNEEITADTNSVATNNGTNITQFLSVLDAKALVNPKDYNNSTQSNSIDSTNHDNSLVYEHKRLESFFNRQKLSPTLTENKSVNADESIGYKKSLLNIPMNKKMSKNGEPIKSNAKFHNTNAKKDQPIISQPVLIPRAEQGKINVNRSIQGATRPEKLTNIPVHRAILIQFPTIKNRIRTLNQERLKNFYNTLVMKKLHAPRMNTQYVKVRILPGENAAERKTADNLAMQKKVRVLSYQKANVDLQKKIATPAKRLRPVTSTMIKNLARNLKRDILNVWPYPNYIKTPADVMLDQGLINRAKLSTSTGRRLDDVFSRAVHGEDVKISYISSSLFRKMSVGSGKPHTLLYNEALLYWYHKVITPITGSRLIQVKVEIPNVNEDYFSRCLKNHLPHPEDINLVIWELAEMDHFPNGKLVPANRILTENTLRNILNFTLNPEIIMVDFYRGNTLNKSKYCHQLSQDTERKLAGYYDCTFLSWSKSVCPYLRDDEEGFSFSYLFSGDKRHPSIIGHAQMAYILIDYIRDAFMKYISRNSISPTYRNGVVSNVYHLPKSIFSDIQTSLCYTTLKSLGNAHGPENSGLRLLFIHPKDAERMEVRSSIMAHMGTSDVHVVTLRFQIPGRPHDVTSTTLGILPYISRPLLTMVRIDDQPFLHLETSNVKRGRIMELQPSTSLKSGSHMVRFYSLDKRFNVLAFTVDEKRSTK